MDRSLTVPSPRSRLAHNGKHKNHWQCWTSDCQQPAHTRCKYFQNMSLHRQQPLQNAWMSCEIVWKWIKRGEGSTLRCDSPIVGSADDDDDDDDLSCSKLWIPLQQLCRTDCTTWLGRQEREGDDRRLDARSIALCTVTAKSDEPHFHRQLPHTETQVPSAAVKRYSASAPNIPFYVTFTNNPVF